MVERSTILLEKKTIQVLKEAKEYPRQTYDELVKKMGKLFIEWKKKNQYDEFLLRIQQEKMGELWDNEKDEVWENA